MQTLFDPKQASLILRLPPDTIRRLARDGEIAGTKLGKQWRFTEQDLQAFIDRGRRFSKKLVRAKL